MKANKKDRFNKLQNSYLKKVDAFQKGSLSYRNLLEYVKEHGENVVAHRVRTEERIFDSKWVDELDAGFAAIDRIIAAPRTFIKENRHVVLAALAKRVSSASVTHLASHSQFIHGFDDDGNVIPERILTIDSDDDYQTYENRLVMSLMQKLAIFVTNRYQYIKDHGETRNSNVLLLHSIVEIDGVRYEIDNRIKLSVPSDEGGKAETNNNLLERIQVLMDRVLFYLECPFMKKMAGAKPIHNPISMTNLLEKNPDYHAVVKLWRFVDSYTKMGVDYSIVERNEEFDENYFNEVYGLLLQNILTLKAHETDAKSIPFGRGDANKTITPKTLLNLDDITFLDGKFQYDDFPEIKKRWEETLTRKKGEEEFAPTPEEVRAIKEADLQARREMIIYARDIHFKQELYREKAEREENRDYIEKRNRFNNYLEAEGKRLDEIEAFDAARRAEEERAYAERLEAEHQKYEDLLMKRTREMIEEEAKRDLALETGAKEEGKEISYPKEEVRQEEVAPKEVFGATISSSLYYKIQEAIRLARIAAAEAKGHVDSDHLYKQGNDGSKTYHFTLEDKR